LFGQGKGSGKMENNKDKVATIGMGCTKFSENWDVSPIDLMIEAAYMVLLN